MGATWDKFTDTGENLLGDPAGYITGTNTEGFGGVKKMLFGDPAAMKKAYDDAIAMAQSGAGQTQMDLMAQKKDALKYYAPLQHMFESQYGTEGLRPQESTRAPVQPQAASGPLGKMFGGK